MYKETSKANTGEGTQFVKMWKRTKPNLMAPKKMIT